MKTKKFTIELPLANCEYINTTYGKSIPQYVLDDIANLIDGESSPLLSEGRPKNMTEEHRQLRVREEEIRRELGDRTLRHETFSPSRLRELIVELVQVIDATADLFLRKPRPAA